MRLTQHAELSRILAGAREESIRTAVLPERITLLTHTANKTVKGERYGILTGILYLSPANESGRNVCPWASAQCKALCLGHSSGRMRFDESRNARLWRTGLYFYARQTFMEMLRAEIRALVERAHKLGMRPAVRLDGTSDIGLALTLAPEFPRIRFYDYTASKARALQHARGELPKNWHVTFSRKENNESACLEVLSAGGSVAVVFERELPRKWNGFKVIDGDLSDVRFRDPRGVIVGLKAKGGLAKRAAEFDGFVIPARPAPARIPA